MNPSILWAQDRTHLFITIDIHNFNNHNIVFSDNNVNLEGVSNNIDYNITIDFNNAINIEDSKWLIKQNCIELNVSKNKSLFWHKLTKNKQNNVKIDWHKWRDEEDDEDNELINDFSNFKKQLPEEFLNQNLDDLLGDNFLEEVNEDVGEDGEDGEDGELEDRELKKESLDSLKIDELSE
jgi:hypothetical protein